jgi:hypothetical protein
MLNNDFSYFFVFAVFNLVILTYQDFKRGKVDNRWNWYMGGVVGSVVALKSVDLVVLLVFVGVALLFSMIMSRVVGKGDISAFSWIIVGLGLIESGMSVVFLLFLVSFACVHYGARVLMRIGLMNVKVPFYPVILSSFLCTVMVFI